jgi:NADH:ubiquinone oxidoreductase subunit F (NADH-binding)
MGTSPDVESFYHLAEGLPANCACRGLACFVARGERPDVWARATSSEPRVYCLGRCHDGPAELGDTAEPAVAVRARHGIVLGRIARGVAPSLDAYVRDGGYAALDAARARGPESVLDEIDASRLRGRGGAGFGAGRKWRAVAARPAATKYVVANADEGDPGAYVDRILIEREPHRLLEALAIAGLAVGASKGYVYLRCEYPRAREVLAAAIDEARRADALGSFDVELVVGRGSYVCGEESALLNSIEGVRPETRLRPPYPAEAGLYGMPTLVTNVETLASVPWIFAHGGARYATLGFSSSRGTKAVSLNSLFCRPGLYEIEFGVSVRHIVDELGGGLRTGAAKGVIIGGPLAGIVPPELFDTRFGFEELAAIGANVGHGGVVAFDDRTSVADLLRHAFAFGAYESCGRCTPCREGTRRIARLLGRKDATGTRELLDEVVTALSATSHCGLGTGLADLARSASRYYGKDLDRWFA